MQQLQQRGLRRSLALVVGCTNGKSLPVPAVLRVAALAAGAERFKTWWQRLGEAQTRRPVRNLYSGSQWAASLDLERSATALGHNVDLWVLSAGLGLVPASLTAPAYAASFSSGPDLVAGTPAGRREWWGELRARTSSFLDVAERYDQMLVVLAPTYLEVISADLSRLDGRALAVVSSARYDSVYSSSGLRPALRASAMTLNAAAAAKLLSLAGDSPLNGADVRARWEQWSTDNARRGAIARQGASDDEVIAFIEGSRTAPRASRTALLTQFREQGRACEQSRFQRLYEDVVGSSA